MPKTTASDLAWIKKQEAIMLEGRDIVGAASTEALEYVTDAIENFSDKQWRKMTMETQAVEMGVGTTIADVLVPKVYDDMKKKLHKDIGVSKETAMALRQIYIGRVIKNVARSLNERIK